MWLGTKMIELLAPGNGSNIHLYTLRTLSYEASRSQNSLKIRQRLANVISTPTLLIPSPGHPNIGAISTPSMPYGLVGGYWTPPSKLMNSWSPRVVDGTITGTAEASGSSLNKVVRKTVSFLLLL